MAKIWLRVVWIAVIIGMVVLIWIARSHHYLSFEALKQHHDAILNFIRAHPISAPLAYIAIYALLTAFSIPEHAFLSLVGGFLFPFPYSMLYILTGATIGAMLLYLLVNTAIGDIIHEKARPWLAKIEQGFQKDEVSYLLFLRVVPIFPFWMVNLTCVLLEVPFITFAWTTLVGVIPNALIYSEAGASLEDIIHQGNHITFQTIFTWNITLALIALGLLALLPVIVKDWKQWKKK